MGIVEALLQANQDPRNAKAFFHALLTQPLTAIGWEGASGREPVLAWFADGDGEPFIPVFSSVELVPGSLPPGCMPMTAQGHELLQKTRDQGRVVLDPGQPHFRVFRPEDVTAILDRLA